MDNFTIVYRKVMPHEGIYSNHEHDRGGETFKGISRKHHPNWSGWKIIDDIRRSVAKHYDPESDEFNEVFIGRLKENTLLQYRVKDFYKRNYFEVFKGNDLPEELAVELFDNAINLGVYRTIKHLQQALNVLNRNGLLYDDLKTDGIYGSITENAIKRYLDIDGDLGLLVKVINILQGAFYLELMKHDTTQEHFARGWLKRVNINLS